MVRDRILTIKRIIFRLLPSLGKRCDDEVFTQDPHPQLIHHENLRVTVIHLLGPLLVAVDDLVFVPALCIDVVVERLIEGAANV